MIQKRTALLGKAICGRGTRVSQRRRGTFPQRSDSGTAKRFNHAQPQAFTKSAVVAQCGAMTELEPQDGSENITGLRSAAVKALESAARQSDPEEFDRLTRHALMLIERARAIGHRRRSVASEAEATDMRGEHRVQEKDGPRPSRKFTAKSVAVLWRLCLRRLKAR